jgi:hypothetical protein
MPELPTVEGFVKQLRKYIKVASCPEESTCLLSFYCPPRENKDGEEFKGGRPYDLEGLRELGHLDSGPGSGPFVKRPIQSVQRSGNVIEIVFWPEDYSPEKEVQEVIARRIIFKTQGQIGVVRDEDIGLCPVAYMPGTEETMEHGRSKPSAFLQLTNMANSDGSHQVLVLNGQAEQGWSGVRVVRHQLFRSDGGLGSQRWFERAYGKGPDPLRSPLRWATAATRMLLGIGDPLGRLPSLVGTGRPMMGYLFTYERRFSDAQGRFALIHALDSEYCFPGHSAVVEGESLEICRQANIRYLSVSLYQVPLA